MTSSPPTAAATQSEGNEAASDGERPSRLPATEALERWHVLQREASALLRHEELDSAWLTCFEALVGQLRELAGADTDLALYVLLHACGHEVDGYSAIHGLLCSVVGELAARCLQWPEEEVGALVRAALSMNVSMTSMQDALVRQHETPSDAQRRAIDAHADASARMLESAGVADPLWLTAVREHHRVPGSTDLDALPAAERVAQVLRRIDIYTAKLSRRRGRNATSPALAARDTCLEAGGRPDGIGGTLLRVLGLYPPGTWVCLANGDMGVVIARGRRAHTPMVAAVRRSDGGLLMNPVRRDTALKAYAIARGLGAREARVRLQHSKVLQC